MITKVPVQEGGRHPRQAGYSWKGRARLDYVSGQRRGQIHEPMRSISSQGFHLTNQAGVRGISPLHFIVLEKACEVKIQLRAHLNPSNESLHMSLARLSDAFLLILSTFGSSSALSYIGASSDIGALKEGYLCNHKEFNRETSFYRFSTQPEHAANWFHTKKSNGLGDMPVTSQTIYTTSELVLIKESNSLLKECATQTHARLRDYPDIKGDPTDAFISAQTHKIQGENTTSIHGQILHQLSPTATRPPTHEINHTSYIGASSDIGALKEGYLCNHKEFNRETSFYRFSTQPEHAANWFHTKKSNGLGDMPVTSQTIYTTSELVLIKESNSLLKECATQTHARLRDYPDIKGDPTDAFISAQTHKIQGENTTSIHGQILHQLSPTARYKCRSLSLCGFTLAQASGLIKGILPQPFLDSGDCQAWKP
ncbi:hypothetical protein YC2023_072078 [Brassica napus]